MKKYKNLKPTEYNITYKYTCPECQGEHWISELQASVNGFVIVCECETALRIKTIKSITKNYVRTKSKPTSTNNQKSEKQEARQIIDNMPKDLLNKAAGVFVGYGYTEKEAKELLVKAYIEFGITDCWELVKKTLETIGKNNE